MINLRNILDKYNKIFYEDGLCSTDIAINIDDVLSAMKEACEQTIDLCAEIAAIQKENGKIYYSSVYFKNSTYIVSKKSILRTKELIK
jgi:hypothetical protein